MLINYDVPDAPEILTEDPKTTSFQSPIAKF